MIRKILIMMVLMATAGGLNAQTSTTNLRKAVDDAKAKIAKSDSDINNPKKSSLSKTWDSRAKVFADASQAPFKGITPGIPTDKDNNPLYNLEMFVGAPDSKKSDGEYEVWVYPTCEVYVQNAVVQFAKITDPADAKALDKAVEAHRKAAELDTKGTYKNNKATLAAVQTLRKYYDQEGVGDYLLKDYKKAAYNFEQAANLTDFPFPDGDTTFSVGRTLYNAALCYEQSGDQAKAESMLKRCIDLNYELGSCYQKLYSIMKEQGNEKEAIRMVRSAYEKTPNEINLLYILIDAYAGLQQYDEAIAYLDEAIAKTPDMVVLYTVKANMYKGISQTYKTNYIECIGQVSAKKKEAFRERNNAANLKRVEGELAELQKTAAGVKATFMENQNKAEQLFNTAISKDPKNFDVLIATAELYNFDQSAIVDAEKNAITLSEDKDGKLNAAKENELAGLYKKAAEYYEKALTIKPGDNLPLQNLKSIYYKLHDMDNYNRIKEILDNM